MNAQQRIVAQSTFRKIIECGLYFGKGKQYHTSSNFMCHSLRRALEICLITHEQYIISLQEIESCLREAGTGNISFGGMVQKLNDMGDKRIQYREDGDYSEIYYHWVTRRPGCPRCDEIEIELPDGNKVIVDCSEVLFRINVN